MTFVDPLAAHGWILRGHRVESCHLGADTLEELHAMASRIGMKRSWFQDGRYPHYDLTASRRAAAVLAGAAQLGRREFILRMRNSRLK